MSEILEVTQIGVFFFKKKEIPFYLKLNQKVENNFLFFSFPLWKIQIFMTEK